MKSFLLVVVLMLAACHNDGVGLRKTRSDNPSKNSMGNVRMNKLQFENWLPDGDPDIVRYYLNGVYLGKGIEAFIESLERLPSTSVVEVQDMSPYHAGQVNITHLYPFDHRSDEIRRILRKKKIRLLAPFSQSMILMESSDSQ